MKKVNWGVLSTANIAKKVTIPAMLEAYNCNLYGIASRQIGKAKEFQELFGFEHAYGSYEDLLADENIDVVYIPLPNHMHGEWIKKAAKAGKHILCEKPITGSEKELQEVIEVCKENNVILMEAFAYLHNPAINEIKEVIKNGEIGDVTFIEATFLTPTPSDSNIRMKKETLGGSIYDLGCYPISLILNFMDEKPIDVKAIGHLTGAGIDDYANIYLEFKNNIKANALCGMCSGVRGDRFFIYGTKALLDAPIEFNQNGDLTYYIIDDKQKIARTVKAPNNYTLEVEQMGRCILEGEKPHVSNEFSLTNAWVIDRALDEIGY
ncbi:MAG: Gfo/Idh/MocA family oxidoreductase [Clostridiales bacterium]|jgi:predicted dehydrogenase|nr:Gfo/Idh/MocA family oxidoreductase [Clostridiales bacterium]